MFYDTIQSGRVPDVSVRHIHVAHALAIHRVSRPTPRSRTRMPNSTYRDGRPRGLAQSFLLRRRTAHIIIWVTRRRDFLNSLLLLLSSLSLSHSLFFFFFIELIIIIKKNYSVVIRARHEVIKIGCGFRRLGLHSPLAHFAVLAGGRRCTATSPHRPHEMYGQTTD